MMIWTAEVEKLALALPDTQRASLAAQLLSSLPAVFNEDDDGLEEALRRDAELEAHPEIGLTLEQLDAQLALRRR